MNSTIHSLLSARVLLKLRNRYRGLTGLDMSISTLRQAFPPSEQWDEYIELSRISAHTNTMNQRREGDGERAKDCSIAIEEQVQSGPRVLADDVITISNSG